MDSETPLLKYIAAAVGIVIVCFCLGYFVLGPKAPPGRRAPSATPQPQATADAFKVTAAPPPPLSVRETTAQREAARKKAEEATRKKAEEEQLRKAEEDARKAAEVAEGGTEITLENVEPTPDPDATPTVAEGSGEGGTPPATASEATGETKDPVKSSDLAREGSALFRVRVGTSFGTRDSAESLAKELRGRGYSALVIADKPGKFHVQSGAFKDRKGAESLQGELKANGYDAAIQP